MKKGKAAAAHMTMNGVTRSGARFLKTTPKPFCGAHSRQDAADLRLRLQERKRCLLFIVFIGGNRGPAHKRIAANVRVAV